MKNLEIKQVQKETGLSYWVCFEIVYSDLLNSKKMYINRGTYANYTIALLQSKFECDLEFGNDAPRGGIRGNFIKILSNNKAFDDLRDYLNKLDKNIGAIKLEVAAERKVAINAMIITEEERVKFLEKSNGLSNKKARRIANNMAASKLGFYSSEGTHKFMNLK